MRFYFIWLIFTLFSNSVIAANVSLTLQLAHTIAGLNSIQPGLAAKGDNVSSVKVAGTMKRLLHGDTVKIFLPESNSFHSYVIQTVETNGVYSNLTASPIPIASNDSLIITLLGDRWFLSGFFDGHSISIFPGEGGYRYFSDRSHISRSCGVKANMSSINSSSSAAPAPSTATTKGTTVMDILILTTRGFADEWQADSLLHVRHLIDLANQSYIDSEIPVRLNLVGVINIFSPVDPTGYSIDRENPEILLNSITNSPDIARWRNDYGADLVALLRPFDVVNHDSNCGIAWVNGNLASKAFSVNQNGVSGGYSCSMWTLAHEIGHNLGAQHDRAHANTQPFRSYGYGFDRSGIFATIMSYETPKIGMWSTPTLNCAFGHSCGSTSDDNARLLRETTNYASGFRGTVYGVAGLWPLQVTASDGTNTETIVLGWDEVINADKYLIQRSPEPNFLQPSLVESFESAINNYSDNTPEVGVNYFYRVASCSSNGMCSLFSSPDIGYLSAPDGAPASPPWMVATSSLSDHVLVRWGVTAAADYYQVGWTTDQNQTPASLPELPLFDIRVTNDTQIDMPAYGPNLSSTVNYYWVRACNTYGCSNWDSSPGARTLQSAPLNPAIITMISTGEHTDRIELQWEPVPGAMAYNINRGMVPSPVGHTQTSHLDPTHWIDTISIEAGEEYFYTVEAVNDSGIGPTSSLVSGHARLTSPVVSDVSVGQSDSVIIEWYTRPQVERYDITRIDTSNGTQILAGSIIQPIAVPFTLEFVDEGMDLDKLYLYQVQACNTLSCSDYSDARLGWAGTRAANLGVSLDVSSSLVDGQFEHAFEVLVTNKGSLDARKVGLNIEILPMDGQGYPLTESISYNSSQGQNCTSQDGFAHCFGFISNGGSAAYTLRTSIAANRIFETSFSVSSFGEDIIDPISSNNSVTFLETAYLDNLIFVSGFEDQ